MLLKNFKYVILVLFIFDNESSIFTQLSTLKHLINLWRHFAGSRKGSIEINSKTSFNLKISLVKLWKKL